MASPLLARVCALLCTGLLACTGAEEPPSDPPTPDTPDVAQMDMDTSDQEEDMPAAPPEDMETPEPDATEDMEPEVDETPDMPEEPVTCEQTCNTLADCLVDQCDGFSPNQRPNLYDTCMNTCNEDFSSALAGRTCQEQIDRVRPQNDNVRMQCLPSDGVDLTGHPIAASYQTDVIRLAEDVLQGAGQ